MPFIILLRCLCHKISLVFFLYYIIFYPHDKIRLSFRCIAAVSFYKFYAFKPFFVFFLFSLCCETYLHFRLFFYLLCILRLYSQSFRIFPCTYDTISALTLFLQILLFLIFQALFLHFACLIPFSRNLPGNVSLSLKHPCLRNSQCLVFARFVFSDSANLPLCLRSVYFCPLTCLFFV